MPKMDIPIFNETARKRSFPRSQYLLNITIDNYLRRHPTTHVLFTTLTFRHPVKSPAEAHRRLNSFMNKLRKRYGSYLWVLGCHDSGGLHYHILVFVDFDCHAGTDLTAWSNPLADYTRDRDREQRNAMNPQLRAESEWWNRMAPRHGFGRVQVAPIYGTAERVHKYLLKQAPEACQISLGDTRNVRFWSCSRDLRVGTTKFAWNSLGAAKGRARIKQWAAEQGCNSYEELRALFGPRWGWKYKLSRERQQATV